MSPARFLAELGTFGLIILGLLAMLYVGMGEVALP